MTRKTRYSGIWHARGTTFRTWCVPSCGVECLCSQGLVLSQLQQEGNIAETFASAEFYKSHWETTVMKAHRMYKQQKEEACFSTSLPVNKHTRVHSLSWCVGFAG